jgi:dolichol-phosphate mannosyltransferase
MLFYDTHRVAGESKLTMKENILYLQQLGNLYWDMYSLLLLSLIFIMVLAISYLARCLL